MIFDEIGTKCYFFSEKKKLKNRIFNQYKNLSKNCHSKETNTDNTNKFNCRNSNKCPLQNSCQTDSLVYLRTISTIENSTVRKFYFGCTKYSFKTRRHQHVLSFSNNAYRNRTSLSKYFWNLKQVNKTPTVKWKMLRKKKY